MEILDVETEDRNGLVHVALKGELDLSTVAKVQDELRRVEEGEPPVMVLDLSRLTFLDSTGLGAIVHGWRLAADHGRVLQITDASPAIRRLLKVTGLEDLLEPQP